MRGRERGLFAGGDVAGEFLFFLSRAVSYFYSLSVADVLPILRDKRASRWSNGSVSFSRKSDAEKVPLSTGPYLYKRAD